MKCSGELPTCARCNTDGITCRYSEKKTMGRPRKRKAAAIEDFCSSRSVTTPYIIPSSLDFPDINFSDLSLPGFDWSSEGQAIPNLLTSSTDWLSQINDQTLLSLDKSPLTFPQLEGPVTPTWMPTPSQGDISVPDLIPAFPPTPCACNQNFNTSLVTLSNLPTAFPLALTPLRSAIAYVRQILRCPTCVSPSNLGNFHSNAHTPTSFIRSSITTSNNTMLLATLIPYIAYGYARLIANIDMEAATGARKRFRLGELGNTELEASHTGTHDCPVGLEVEMEAPEWRAMLRGVVKRDLVGTKRSVPTDGNQPGKDGGAEYQDEGLVGLVKEMEARQRVLHDHNAMLAVGLGYKATRCNDGKGPLCMQMVELTRRAVDMVDVN
ncbi:hypothetical protein MMC19_001119 [Ptychographa xylographoides]|nr:hypothetical protein [Ptychographa xylographoides]